MNEKPKAQKIPPLFKAIIANDEQRRISKQSAVTNFAEFKRLQIEHRDFMRAAEKMYAGTKNKGKDIG